MNERRLSEALWSREKYRVMLHSQAHYEQIRKTLKRNSSLADIETLIDEALRVPPTPGSIRNTIQHMWGYFKKHADQEEKNEYRQLLEQFSEGNVDEREPLLFIRRLAEKYKTTYLLNSTVLDLKPWKK